MHVIRVLSICFVLTCFQCVKVYAEVVEFKFYDYEATLDVSPRAQQEGWHYWAYAKESRFRALQHEYNFRIFDEWTEKLKLIQSGMTIEEIKAAIKPKKIDSMMIMLGAGVIAFIELDDIYFIHGLFSDEGKLINVASHPISITYGIRRDNSPSKTAKIRANSLRRKKVAPGRRSNRNEK